MSLTTVQQPHAEPVSAEPVNPYGLPGDMTPAQAVAALTRRPGVLPQPGGANVSLMLPTAFVGPLVALQVLGFAPSERRPRLDLRVRHLDDGQVVEDGLRRVHHVHLLRQLGGLRRGEWTVGRFERMHRHGAQWQVLPHKSPPRARLRPAA
ncbi:hypothetical protein GCM10010302_26340 [Streptomyces polychromogenes]|uniref:Uncharacterized protein n=1 Tax=Streptomyces polychromogenes TaxID=67342 RepID=A0ABN0VCP8_9ACTN